MHRCHWNTSRGRERERARTREWDRDRHKKKLFNVIAKIFFFALCSSLMQRFYAVGHSVNWKHICFAKANKLRDSENRIKAQPINYMTRIFSFYDLTHASKLVSFQRIYFHVVDAFPGQWNKIVQVFATADDMAFNAFDNLFQSRHTSFSSGAINF